MKKIISILLVFIILNGCKKEFHFNTSEITETDIDGNLVGNINQSDWKLKKLDDASDFDKKAFSQIYRDSGSFNISLYKGNCPLPDTFNLVVYPNPMKNINLYHKVTKSHNFNYEYGVELKVKKNGELIGATFFPNSDTWTMKVNKLVVRDFICYTIFITADSCAYYTKGNVIGWK